MTRKTHNAKPWPDAQVEEELRALHKDEKQFLTLAEMKKRGRGALAAQVGRYGSRYWAWRIQKPTARAALKPRLSWPEAERRAKQVIAELGRLPGIGELRALRYQQLAQFIEREAGSREEFLKALDYTLAEIDQLLVRPAPVHRKPWTEAEIRAAVERFCEGRTYFPVAREFREAGLYSLYLAVRRYGGLQYWAERMGLPRTAGSQRRGRRPQE